MASVQQCDAKGERMAAYCQCFSRRCLGYPGPSLCEPSPWIRNVIDMGLLAIYAIYKACCFHERHTRTSRGRTGEMFVRPSVSLWMACRGCQGTSGRSTTLVDMGRY